MKSGLLVPRAPGHGFAMFQRSGILLVVSGPSGSGKTTLCRRLAATGEAHYSISCTTRQPREGEINGTDYHFLTREEFEARIASSDFLEHALVHGNRYGSLKSEVLAHIEHGRDVVMDIDVQGAAQVRACQDPRICGARVDLFVMPPDEATLRERLTGRGTDSPEIVELRMTNALDEMQQWQNYAYLLHSADRETDYRRFLALLDAERMCAKRLKQTR